MSDGFSDTISRVGWHGQRRFAPSHRKPRLLIADDEPVVCAALSAQLGRVFEVVAVAEDGEDAVAEAARELPDAALIDVEMPAGGGLRATRGIREVSPNTAVVILSMNGSTDSIVELMRAGALSYIPKGMPAALIAERLRQSMTAHRTVTLR
jgi:DNA-binding NarL/FixJ family response regulator